MGKQTAAEILRWNGILRRDGVHTDAVEKLINGGDAKQYLRFRRVYEGDAKEFQEAVDELAETSSDIDAKDGLGNTLLHVVLNRLGNTDVHTWHKVKMSVEKLLEKGAGQSIMNKRGRTAKDIMNDNDYFLDAELQRELLQM